MTIVWRCDVMTYPISHEMFTWFCCTQLCHGCFIFRMGFIWFLSSYPSRLLKEIGKHSRYQATTKHKMKYVWDILQGHSNLHWHCNCNLWCKYHQGNWKLLLSQLLDVPFKWRIAMCSLGFHRRCRRIRCINISLVVTFPSARKHEDYVYGNR